MATRPMKTITLPGLSDTYTFAQIDNTLTTSGKAADAKKTGDELSNLKSALSTTHLSPLRESYGFIGSSNGSATVSGTTYSFSNKIEVVPGDRYEYAGLGSASVLVLAAYENESDTSAIVAKSIVGTTGTLKKGVYTVPDGVHYLRICSSNYYTYAVLRPYLDFNSVFERVYLSVGTDLDTITSVGVYTCLNNSFSDASAPPCSSDVGTLFVTKDTTTGIIYQTFIESYTGRTYTRIKRTQGWDNWAYNYSKEISILFVGNSLTQDGIAYLPYLLKNYFPEISFKFYTWYNGGKTLAQQYEYFTGDTVCDIFSVAENTASWTNYSSSKKMSSILATYKFDVVCMQEYFNYKDSYTVSDLDDWNNCQNYIQSHYTGGNPLEFVSLFHAPLRSSATSVFNLTKTGNGLILQDTVAQDMIPIGIAIYRALSTSLNSLGDQGGLSNDGTHAQEGLPCLLQTYTALCWLLDKLSINKSVYGFPFKMTTAIYNTLSVPGPNLGTGVIEGTDAQNLLAQEIAIKAYKEGKAFVNNNIFVEPST